MLLDLNVIIDRLVCCIMKSKNKNINSFFPRLVLLYISYSILCRYLYAINRFSNGEVFIQYSLYAQTLLCIPFLYYAYNQYKINFCQKNMIWITFSMFYLFIVELLNTLFFSDVYNYIIPDMVFWCFFFSMFLLGASEKFWEMFMAYAVLIVLFTCFASIFELTTKTYSYMRDAWDNESYLYDVQLGFSVLHIILVYFVLTKQKHNRKITIVAFAFFFILQFIFQKRLPLFHNFLIIVFLFYVSRRFVKKITMKYMFLVLLVVTLLSVFFIPDKYFNATVERFTERGNVTKTVETDTRYLIAGRAVSRTLDNSKTILFGQGLGGTLLGNFGGKTIKYQGKEISGIVEIEFGAVTVFYRYGIIFFIVIFGKIIMVLLQFGKYRNNPLSITCWTYLIVFLIMTMVGESFPGVSTPIFTLMVAGSLGYLSSYNATKKSGYFVSSYKSL